MATWQEISFPLFHQLLIRNLIPEAPFFKSRSATQSWPITPNAQGNDPRKRKADALSPNSGTAEKRPYQNRTTSAREPSPEARLMARSSLENIACTPLAAGETALIASPSHTGPNDVLNPVNLRTSAVTVASQLQGDVSLLSHNDNIRRVHLPAFDATGSEMPLRETSVVPVPSNGADSHGRSYSSLPSASLDGNEYENGLCTTLTTTMTRPTEVFTATAFPPATSLQNNTTVPSSAGFKQDALTVRASWISSYDTCSQPTGSRLKRLICHGT
ncbi:hypothetical protein PSPO01_16180 [Paraphaeosphaeria sporulosa]